MGRKAGSKNQPKSNGNGNGHNSTLTDDERRALTLHHMRLYVAADALVEKAKAERTAVSDQAKADLGKGTLADIKDLILYADDNKMRASLERLMRLAKYNGLPIGFQVDMFADRAPIEEKWAEDGKTAGMAGENCSPPSSMPPSGAQIWIQNWHAGQAILASAFGKKKADVPAPQPVADTSSQPFAPPEQAPADPS